MTNIKLTNNKNKFENNKKNDKHKTNITISLLAFVLLYIYIYIYIYHRPKNYKAHSESRALGKYYFYSNILPLLIKVEKISNILCFNFWALDTNSVLYKSKILERFKIFRTTFIYILYIYIYIYIYMFYFLHPTTCESTCDALPSSAANQG